VASCGANQKLLGGGYSWIGTGSSDEQIRATLLLGAEPDANLSSYTVTIKGNGNNGTANGAKITAWAICRS
jgi:hypothetical protein